MSNMRMKHKLIMSMMAGMIIIPGSVVRTQAAETDDSEKSLVPVTGIENILEASYQTEIKNNINLYLVPTEEGEYLNIAFSNTGDYTYIRSEADENSEWVGKLYSDSAAVVLEYLDGWTKIRSGNAEGYVPTETLFTGEEARSRSDEYTNENVTVTADCLNVREGQVVAIIGPSGSGKSTLLRCATMLEKIDDGELSYLGERAAYSQNGEAVYEAPGKLKQLKSYYGLVFQNFNLFPHYSVMKNICDAPIRVQKREKKEVQEQAKVLLKKMGLEDKADAYPYQLSGGQQQRVSIARALCMNPKILFFDEPTSALDPQLTGEILKVIKDLAAEHMTMVIVTHEMNFARNVADHIVFMENGVIVKEGAPEELFTSDNQRIKEFLGKFQD